ncbi:CDGSH iron-sulfur domain-containing protein [Micromonospora sp. NBC_01796]|uniref:CDGSH iron-sulfur domain-containing protein n=1 Tax=Micromonospora sp. NBC_01796 TaxID=2975987 RepID=UPI002DDA5A35|nr:CDGSH iron-sulfur domain-containing protein [Micromonospora sp. NBC_01796]WSA83253.1 CDGSH iron-sulfur domain-containing protein [Micromonospora sp. NBC_01796]
MPEETGQTGNTSEERTDTAASVTVYENGPLLVRGEFTLRTALGGTVDPGRDTIALCRCGKSSLKPFCDGTHKAIGFRAAADPDPRPDAGADSRPDAGGDSSAGAL